MSEDERLTYTVGEAAERLGIARSTAWLHIKEGRLPVVRLGRRTLVSRAAIRCIVEQGGYASAERARPAPRAGQEAPLRVMK